MLMQTKDKTELDGVEHYVYQQLMTNDKSWLPRSRFVNPCQMPNRTSHSQLRMS